MRRFLAFVIFIFLVSIVVYAIPGTSNENKPIRHWYRLEIQTGETTYQCLGSSVLDEKEFAKQLSGDEYIVLDDVEYLDSTGKIKGWQEWDPKSVPRLYVNPDYVILFNPMKDDPRKSPTSGAVQK
jgi:hypothetical protein